MTVILMPETNPARVRHLLYGHADWLDNAPSVAITGTTPSTGTSFANLLEPQPTDLFACAPSSSMYLEFDRGGDAAFNVVSLLYTNATSAAQWRVRAGPSSGTWSAFDSGTLTLWPQPGLETWRYAHAFLFIPATVTARVVRIDIDDAGNPATRFYVGRAFISLMWQPTFNYDYGINFGHVGQSQKRRMPGSQTRRLARRPVPFVEWTIKMLQRDEMFSIAHRIERERGDAEDVLVVADPGDALHLQEMMAYGTVSDLQAISLTTHNRYEKTWRVEALL